MKRRNPKADPRWRKIAVDTPVSIPRLLALIRRLNRMARNWGWSLALLLLPLPALGNDAPELAVTDHVQRIDQNAVYCPESGRRVLAQLVFIDWYPRLERSEIVAWRTGCPRAEYDWQRRKWVVLWIDSGVLRRVEANVCGQSAYYFDWEVAARECFPVELRRGLR